MSGDTDRDDISTDRNDISTEPSPGPEENDNLGAEDNKSEPATVIPAGSEEDLDALGDDSDAD